MSEEIHRRIVAFLGGEFARSEGRQCISVELVTAQSGGRGDSLGIWERKERPELFDGMANVENLATDILKISEDHVESYNGGGSHRYVIRTKQHLGGQQQHAFRLFASADESDGGSDPPNATGLVGQLMRHNEIKEKTLVGIVQSTIGTMSHMIRDLAEENREMRRDKNLAANELEEARSKKDERDLESLRQINADKRKDQAFEKIMTLLPVLANRMLGEGAVGATPTPISILANELGESLSQEQQIKIASILAPSQIALLVELMKTAKMATAKEDQQKAAQDAAQASAG